MKYDKQYLYNAYNATSTETFEGSDELETYENWLERQLIARLIKIDELQANGASTSDEALPIADVGGSCKPHICGLHGYNPIIDPPCPACKTN